MFLIKKISCKIIVHIGIIEFNSDNIIILLPILLLVFSFINIGVYQYVMVSLDEILWNVRYFAYYINYIVLARNIQINRTTNLETQTLIGYNVYFNVHQCLDFIVFISCLVLDNLSRSLTYTVIFYTLTEFIYPRVDFRIKQCHQLLQPALLPPPSKYTEGIAITELLSSISYSLSAKIMMKYVRCLSM